MLSLFWTPAEQLPAGSGFALFGAAHVCWLVILAAAGALGAWQYRRCSDRVRRRIGWAVSAALLLLELARQVVLFVHRCASVYYLPFHLCSLSMFMLVVHTLRPTAFTGEVLYALGMPGAFAALLLPDWAACPPVHFMAFQGFLGHGLIVWLVVCKLWCREIVPSVKRIWMPAVFLAGSAAVMTLVNRTLGTNYLFLQQPPSALLSLSKSLSIWGYRAVLFGMVLLVWFLLYLPGICRWRKKEG